MIITKLKSKIHRATVTDSLLGYEGSCAIGPDLIEASGIVEYQQLDIYNVNNGERFTTYAILGDVDGEVSVRGAAARKVQVGDIVIIATYGIVDEKETVVPPTVVHIRVTDGKNIICN